MKKHHHHEHHQAVAPQPHRHRHHHAVTHENGGQPHRQYRTEMPSTPVASEGSDWQRGTGSWFGHYGKWQDPEYNGKNASGLSEATPGIALRNKATLGHWYEVTFPNGKTVMARQVDVGPFAKGRSIDINGALADKAGYSPGNFPTDETFHYRYVGAKLPDASLMDRAEAKPSVHQAPTHMAHKTSGPPLPG